MYRLGNVRGHVERNVVGHAFREACAYLFHLSPDIFRHLHGIGTRKHIDIDNGRIAGIDTALGIVGLGFERDSRDILQPDDGAVFACADDDVLELLHRRQTSGSRNRNRHIHIRNRLLAKHSGRRLTVLVLQCTLQVLDSDSKARHLVRLHPDLHCIITAADIGNASHAGHAPEPVLNIQRRVVAEVHLVEFRVVGHYGYRHQFAGRLLFHGNAVLHHLRRKPGLGQLHTVLDLHRGKVRIGRDVEGQCR